MKTLVKISFVIVCALFVSMSAKAVDPLSQTGTIKVNVPEKLELALPAANFEVNFTQAYGATTGSSVDTDVQIKANVKWTLKIETTATNFVASYGDDVVPVSNVTLTGDFNQGTFGSIPALDGQKDKSGKITWNLANLGSIYAGDYTAPVTFTLAKQNP